MLRPVTAGETLALAQLWHDGWQVGHRGIVPDGLIRFRTVDQFHDRILASIDDCFVTGPADQLDGFVRLKGDELDQFYVAPTQIGKGAARGLMQAAEALMRERGISDAYLIAAKGNARAVRFYEKCGWRNAGEHRAGVETAAGPFEMDVIRLEKSL